MTAAQKGCTIIGLPLSLADYFSAIFSQKRMRITAAWARVAEPPGVRVVSLVPLTKPSALAHWRAARA